MGEIIKILGVAGSLRKESYNRFVLRAAIKLAPREAQLDTFELDDIPPFNQDHEREPPHAVRAFKTAVRTADAILIVTPEYNYSVPGVLKNAIDWASRPYGDSAWDGKPVGVMGASVGTLGTARAQYHLRQMFVFLNMFPLNQPEVMIAQAEDKFDNEGNLKDPNTTQRIRELLEALIGWTKSLQKAKTSS
ncbi:MAG: NADPH-dependent FMN reductase [Nitrospira sp. SG-bin1]|nr:MAG: NADPH-dependent FMN reductase [Nitrospira sp. SG-bin1]